MGHFGKYGINADIIGKKRKGDKSAAACFTRLAFVSLSRCAHCVRLSLSAWRRDPRRIRKNYEEMRGFRTMEARKEKKEAKKSKEYI